jgi:hypothetical protein
MAANARLSRLPAAVAIRITARMDIERLSARERP